MGSDRNALVPGVQWKHVALWGLYLLFGSITGVLMIPVELAAVVIAKLLGAEDARLSDIGFVFRQFTDIRALRSMYPLFKQDLIETTGEES